jgi:hypothetical protein
MCHRIKLRHIASVEFDPTFYICPYQGKNTKRAIPARQSQFAGRSELLRNQSAFFPLKFRAKCSAFVPSALDTRESAAECNEKEQKA